MQRQDFTVAATVRQRRPKTEQARACRRIGLPVGKHRQANGAPTVGKHRQAKGAPAHSIKIKPRLFFNLGFSLCKLLTSVVVGYGVVAGVIIPITAF